MNLLIYIFAFVVFACVGSFIGVCADRIPRGEQIYKGRSHCDSCGRELKAWADDGINTAAFGIKDELFAPDGNGDLDR